VNWHKHERG